MPTDYASSDGERVYRVEIAAGYARCECAAARYKRGCRHLRAEAERIAGPGASVADARHKLRLEEAPAVRGGYIGR